MSQVDPGEILPFAEPILQAPEDDGPRLALAEFLLSRGDMRGEHIRVACALESLERDDPLRAKLEARLRELPWLRWLTPPPAAPGLIEVDCRRGLAEKVYCTPEYLVAHGEALVRCAPIRSFKAYNGHGKGKVIAQATALRSIPCFEATSIAAEDVMDALLSPHFAGLRELELSSTVGATFVDRLALPLLPALERLEAHWIQLQPADIEALVRFAEARPAMVLDLTHAHVYAPYLEPARARLGDRLLPRPPPPPPTFAPATLPGLVRFGKLAIGGNQVTDALLLEIAASGPYPTVTDLRIGAGSFGESAVCALLASPAFPSTVHLGLDNVRTAEVLRTLARAAHLPALETVDLGTVADEKHPGPSEEEVLALARADGPPSLAEIRRDRTWRAYSEGAKEEIESVPVTRANGRVVRVVVDHSIWP